MVYDSRVEVVGNKLFAITPKSCLHKLKRNIETKGLGEAQPYLVVLMACGIIINPSVANNP